MAENEKITRYKRGENPNSIKNLQMFSSKKQPKKNGRPKGSSNRATIFERWLSASINVEDPDNPKKKIRVSMLEAAALGQINAAMLGKTEAFREIQDTLHGKMPDKVESDVTQQILVEFVKRDDNSDKGNSDQG